MTPGGDVNPSIELGPKSSSSETTATTSGSPPWIRFLLPSVTDLLFILLVFSLTIGAFAPRLLSDAGTGWHIRNGDLMLRTGTITRTDPFSATMNGQRWYAWEWLFDGAAARIHQWAGLNGVVLVAALIISFAFALTFRLSLRRGGSLLITLFLLVLALGASAIHLFARPHVFSWLLAVIWFQLLDSSEKAIDPTNNRSLFWLPVITLFWVNVHGGFVLGFALCGIYLAAGCSRLWRTHDPAERQMIRRWIWRLSLVSGICFVVGLINPFGYNLYTHVYQYLSDRFLMNHIDEFRSPDFHGVAQQCFAALLLIAMAALAVAGKKLRTSELLVLIFAAYSGLYASRNLPVSSLLMTLVLAPLLSQALTSAAENVSIPFRTRHLPSVLNAFSARMTRAEAGLRGHLWPLVAVLGGLLLVAHQGMMGRNQLMQAHFDAKRFPVAAVNEIERRQIAQPIFSEDYWGGYLIYRLYPRNRVFVDDRHDFYGDAFLKRYLKIIRVEPGWDAALKEVNPNYLLLTRESTLTNILKEVPQWKVIYEDETATLFENADR
jgi:hypothetical protein